MHDAPTLLHPITQPSCPPTLASGEDDWIVAMSTVASELHAAFDYFHWTGFYRTTAPGVLKLGPYQGGTACLTIPFSRGVCGAAAREARTQLVPDVHSFPGHIACASSTLSEIVVPVCDRSNGTAIAVLDIDSNLPAAFTASDVAGLEHLTGWLEAQSWNAKYWP